MGGFEKRGCVDVIHETDNLAVAEFEEVGHWRVDPLASVFKSAYIAPEGRHRIGRAEVGGNLEFGIGMVAADGLDETLHGFRAFANASKGNLSGTFDFQRHVWVEL